jgi:hypothetical protein
VFAKLPLFGGRHFHPAKHDTSELEQRWREALFGDDGSLRGQLRRSS